MKFPPLFALVWFAATTLQIMDLAHATTMIETHDRHHDTGGGAAPVDHLTGRKPIIDRLNDDPSSHLLRGRHQGALDALLASSSPDTATKNNKNKDQRDHFLQTLLIAEENGKNHSPQGTVELDQQQEQALGTSIAVQDNRKLGSDNDEFCAGITEPGQGWATYSTTGLYIDVDTSLCGFESGETPKYFATLAGGSHHWKMDGATAIYGSSNDGFRVYIYPHSSLSASSMLSWAQSYGWRIHWVAYPSTTSSCVGSAAISSEDSSSYGSAVTMPVDTSACGFSSTADISYFTSVTGTGSHWKLEGTTGIYNTAYNSYRLYMYLPGKSYSQLESMAASSYWAVQWVAHHTTSVVAPCSGITTIDQGWKAYNSDMYIDVDTSKCNFPNGVEPVYITSLKGTGTHWKINGVSSVYSPKHNTFRLYMFYHTDHNHLNEVDRAHQHNFQVQWFAYPPTSVLADASGVLDDLDSIETDAATCKEHLVFIHDKLKHNILGPLQLTIADITDLQEIHKHTVRVKRSMSEILNIAKFVPKFSKVAKTASKLIKQLDEILGTVLLEPDWEALNVTTIPKVKKVVKSLDSVIKKLSPIKYAAIASGVAVTAAEACVSNTDSVADDLDFNGFIDVVEEPIGALRVALDICALDISLGLFDIDWSFLYEIMNFFNPILAIKDFIKGIADALLAVVDAAAGAVTEVLCCGIPPHAQSFLTLVTEAIDLSTCFADFAVDEILEFLDSLILGNSKLKLWDELTFPSLEFPVLEYNQIEFDESFCGLAGGSSSIGWETLSFTIPAVELDFNLYDESYEVCSTDGLDPANWWGGDCCCQARDIISEPGTLCLRFELFTLPGSYEAAAAISGLERCTCCENNEYVQCSGQTAICGTSLPTPKKAGEPCEFGADCLCEGDISCGSLVNGDYICCPNGSWSSAYDAKEYCSDMAGAGDECPGWASSNDNYCAGNLECGEKVSGSNDYICCEHGTSICGTDDCCKYSAKDGEACWQDDQCESGFCWCGSDGVCTSAGVCKPTGLGTGATCDTTRDRQCAGSRQCGKRTGLSSDSNDYVCCWSTWVPGGWTTDVCKNMVSKGGSCRFDNDCSGSVCARESAASGTPLTCCQSGDSKSWGGYDYCTGMPYGTICWLDSMCAGDMECDGNGYGIQKGECDY